MTALRKIFLFAAAALAASVLAGCSTVVGISPSTTPITEKDTYTVIGKAKGTSRGIVWFIVPTFPDHQSRDARDNALKSSGGDALIEVTEEYHTSCFLIFSFVCTTVEGTAIKFQREGASKK
jgi:hypothetical protein